MKRYKRQGGFISLWDEPSMAPTELNSIIGYLKRNETFLVLEHRESWRRILSGTTTGWIYVSGRTLKTWETAES